MKLGEIIGIYRETQSFTSSTDDKTFTGAYVKPRQIVILDLLGVSDLTTANKALTVGLQRGEQENEWIKKVDLANTYSCDMEGKLILVENERPIGRVESPSDGDSLIFVASGLIYDIKE